MNRILISFVFGLLLAVLAHAQNAPIPTAFQDSCNAQIDGNHFENVGDKNYIFGTTELNWFDALHYCRAIGTQLASPENTDELDKLSTYMVSKNYTNNYWLSGNDLGLEGTFKWMGTGRAFTDITTNDWVFGQPSSSFPNEDCVSFNLESEKYKLNDDDCANVHPFVCENRLMYFLSF